MFNPIMVVSVALGQVYMVAAEVPTPVSVYVLKLFAMLYPNAIANAKAFGSCSVNPCILSLVSLKIICSAGKVQNIVRVPADQLTGASAKVSTALSANVTLVSKTIAVWLVTVATLTMPVMPVPVTLWPTCIVPLLPSTATFVEEVTAPFTEAVAVLVLVLCIVLVRASVVPDKVYVPNPISKSAPSEQA
jgi:hypothetical protein